MAKHNKPEDFEHNGQTWTAFLNDRTLDNGAIPACAGRECDFFRRGECWIEDHGHHCVWPYFWRRKDKEGNILDRDGWKLYDKDGKYIWTGPYGRK